MNMAGGPSHRIGISMGVGVSVGPRVGVTVEVGVIEGVWVGVTVAASHLYDEIKLPVVPVPL